MLLLAFRATNQNLCSVLRCAAQVFRAVESLPFSADDMHHTRSAHGSFADLLRALTTHTDYEVRAADLQTARVPRNVCLCVPRLPALCAAWPRLYCEGCACGLFGQCGLRWQHASPHRPAPARPRLLSLAQVRNKSFALLRQYPVRDCSRPPLAGPDGGDGGGLLSSTSSRSRAGWGGVPQVCGGTGALMAREAGCL